MKIDKIQLINSPLPEGTLGVGNGGVFSAAGIQSLATVTNIFHSEIEIELFDGGILSLDEIVAKLDGDLVAVGALTPTYETAIPLLHKEKVLGATTLLGGHHTYYFDREILNNRHFIDYVLRGDNAEKGFVELISYLKGEIYSPYDISSLSFLDGNKFIRNKISQCDLEAIPIINRFFEPHSELFTENYNKQFGKFHDTIITGTAVTKNAQGCERGALRRCKYCSIPDLRFRKKSPEIFWKEMSYLQSQKKNFVFETADSFSSFAKIPSGSSNYLESIVRTKPYDVETELMVFARAQEITPQVTSYFKEIGVKRVNMGLDSGDNMMLDVGIGKGSTTLETNWNAINLLHNAGIQMYVSFVLGAVGETEQSLGNTYSFIKELVKQDPVVVIDPSPLLPMKGSPSWKAVQDLFVGQDLIDTELAAIKWAERMCKVNYKTILDYNSAILQLARDNGQIPGGFGIKGID